MNESNGRQQLCLKWNNHYHAIQYNFETLLQTEDFADVTLATEGQHIRAHKIVLSSCSPLFQSLLRHTEKDTIIILPSISYAELKAIIVYMYRGEVNIAQDDLPSLLKAAENLQVRGLSDPATEKKPSAAATASSSSSAAAAAASDPSALLASPSSSPAKREHSTREPSPVASKRKKKTSRAASVDSANDSADSSVSEPSDPKKEPTEEEDDDEEAAVASGADDKRTELGLMMEPMAEEYDDDVSGDEMIEEADEADVKPGPSHRGLSQSFPGWASASSRGSIPDISISAVGGNLDSSAASADGRDYYEDEDSLWAPLSNSQGQTGSAAGRAIGKKRNGIFPCEQCGRTYMRKDSLRRHLMWECGKEPQFQCPYCPQRSKRKAHHDRHIFRLHKDKLGLAPDADESAMPRLITPTVTIEPVNKHLDPGDDLEDDDDLDD